MAKLIKPQVSRIYKEKITQLIKDVSTRASVVCCTETEVPCTNCIYDAVNKASSGKYRAGGPQPFTGKTCPVCKNRGKITVTTKKSVEASVVWGKGQPNPNIPLSQGFLPDGQARLKAEIKVYDTFAKATYFLIDSIRCSRIGEPKKRGLTSYVVTEQYVQIDK